MSCPLDLSLTHGQVAWVLARGQPPSQLLLDQLRYLRQLGVPFTREECGSGRGNRIRYGLDHLIELGVALFGLERGMKPREIAGLLVDHRAEFRRCYRDALAAMAPSAFQAEWVKSRGAVVAIMGKEVFLRLRDRHSEEVATLELVPPDAFATMLQQLQTLTYPGGEIRTLLPLTRLVIELVAWAREAPEIKPGRK